MPQSLLLLFASVALTCVSSPGYFAPWLAWVAFVPLFALLRQTSSALRAALWAGAFGLVWSVVSGWPFVGPLVRTSQWSAGVSSILVPVLFLVATIPYALAGFCAGFLRNRGAGVWIMGTAVAWTALPLIFPSVALYMSQWRSPLWMQAAAFGGIHAVQFSLVLVNAAFAIALLGRGVASLRPFLIGAGTIAALAVWGAARISGGSGGGAPAGESLRTIGYIQPGKFPADQNASTLLAASLRDAAEWAKSQPNLDLMVLPEVSGRSSYQDDAEVSEALKALLLATGKPLIAHSRAWTHPPEYRGAPRLMSLSLCFDASGRMLANYAKRSLIPFVEYLPWETTFPALRHLAPTGAPLAPGKLAVVFPVAADVRAIPMLCFESLFSEPLRAQIALGGNLLVEQANDGTIDSPLGTVLHEAWAVFRSVEFGLPLIRATATGVSAAFDARGRLIPASRMENGERGQRAVQVSIPAGLSFYARHEHVFPLCLGLLALGIILSEFVHRHPASRLRSL